ncbi:MAG: right-handed parallel beta-helix repeat-containing protein [Clostridia bacterium]|nr:right-handed parallel beta-helix repeat-containing protein [Clostridia bacterium]
MNNTTKKWLRTLLCLLMALGMVFSLCACPAAEDPSAGETPGTGETPGGDEPTPPPVVPEDIVYGNGTVIEGSGATLGEDSPVLTPTVYDETTATEINAIQFFRGAQREEGKVFRIADGKALTIKNAAGQPYDGAGSILIAPQGVVVTECRDVTISNLTIVGSFVVENSAEITLENVEIISADAAVSADDLSTGLHVKSCRLTGKTALASAASDMVVLDSYFAFTEGCIVDSSENGVAVQNCILEGSGTGIRTFSSNSIFRYNTIKMSEKDIGILLEEGVVSTLVAQNLITDVQRSLVIGSVRNVSVILNTLVSMEASNSKNLYIIDNAMGGRLTAKQNKYFIADGNTYPEDGLNHETVQSDNENHNGDTLMDVDARLEVGADDRLLPHVDKDQFVGMPRKDLVMDPIAEEELPFSTYVLRKAQAESIVIIAPGAYTNESVINFRAAHADTTVYAYGVYLERQEDLGQIGNFYQTHDIEIKGLTMGFKQQTCGQVYVLEKLGNHQLRVVTGAGMMNEFGNTNTKYYNTTGMGAQRMGTFYAYCDTSFSHIVSKNNKVEGVDTMIMQVSPSVYEMLAAGDILTCRANNGNSSVSCSQVSEISFKDVTLYGNAGGLAFYENEAYTGIEYYRVADTTQNGFVISEELYNQYKALEIKYGVSLEVERDDLGRFRGSPAHICSIDATHVVACAEGSQATSCLFENMCDDATNQHAHHSRLADVRDLGNGETMLVYKRNVSERSWDGSRNTSPNGGTKNFKVGDRVYVYTSKGQLVCDTKALSVTVDLKETEPNSMNPSQKISLYGVTVPTASVKMEALDGYDLSDDHYKPTNKVLVDNMDMASNYFNFDNSKFQNIRSRGLLIKASNGTITNCTFRNIGMSCAAILYEIYWGESGVTEDLLVDRNLFDHTGYFKNQDLYATVSITGLGSEVSEDFLLYKDIIISNNHMIRRTTDYAVYVNSAKNVKIIGNTFGPFVGNDFTNHPEDPEMAGETKPVIHIFAAMDVEISGNIYPNPDGFKEDYVDAEKNIHVYGTDVTMDSTVDGPPLIPDDL